MGTTDALAVFAETGVKWRIAMNGWVSARNPNYKAELEASERPWRVIHTIWIEHDERPSRRVRGAGGNRWYERMNVTEWSEHIEEHGPPSLSSRAVAKVYDPRLGKWVYRRLGRVNKQSEWVFLKPKSYPTHFDSLDVARCGFNFDEAQTEPCWPGRIERWDETQTWVRDDDDRN